MRVVFIGNGIDRPNFGAQSASRQLLDEMLSQSDIEFITYPAIEDNWIVPTRKRFLSGTCVDHIRWMYTSSRAAEKLCRRNNADLVHIQSYGGYATLPPNHVPSLITLHDEPGFRIWDYISPLHLNILNWMIRTNNKFFIHQMIKSKPYAIALSSTIRDRLYQKGIPLDRIFVLPNGFVDFPKFDNQIGKDWLVERLGIPENSRIILSIGSMIFEKGVHKVILAARKIKLIDSDIHFIHVGKGITPLELGYVKNLEKMYDFRNASNFHWIGHLEHNQLIQLLHLVDCYISASYTEACSLSLMEAMLAKLPIISTDVGAARDLLDNKAIFLSRFCTSNQIVNALRKMDDYEKRNYPITESLSWKAVAERTIKLYIDILNQ